MIMSAGLAVLHIAWYVCRVTVFSVLKVPWLN